MLKRQAYQKVASFEVHKGEVKKIVLLYSGSTYTSVLIPWLKATYKADIIAVLVDLGQNSNLIEAQQQAKKLGAAEVIIRDAKEEFAKEYITKAIQANAKYQGKYHLTSPLSRPLLAKIAVEVAEAEGASAIAHGCSAQSNDQIRIESIILTLNPDMKIIAPLRDESLFKTQAQKLAKEYKIPQEYQTVYSYDENLWGVSIIGGDIEQSHVPESVAENLHLITPPEKASDTAERIVVEFAKGIPVALNEEKLDLVTLIHRLNTIGGKHGIGLSYVIEDMILGLKGRSIEEEPGSTILIEAHKELEKYVSTKEENEFKSYIDTKWTNLCYEGKWYEPLIQDIEAFIENINKKVSGKVTLRLFKGNIELLSIEVPKHVLEKKLPVSTNAGAVNTRSLAGFIEISSLPLQLANRAEKSILLSVGKRKNKFKLLPLLEKMSNEKYRLYATYKTHKFLKTQGIEAILVNKVHLVHLKPNLGDLLEAKRFDLIIHIPTTEPTTTQKSDGLYIREKAKEHEIPLITSMEEAEKVLHTLHLGEK